MQIVFPNGNVDAILVIALNDAFEIIFTETVFICLPVVDLLQPIQGITRSHCPHHAIQGNLHLHLVRRLGKGSFRLADFIGGAIVNIGQCHLVGHDVVQGRAGIGPVTIAVARSGFSQICLNF